MHVTGGFFVVLAYKMWRIFLASCSCLWLLMLSYSKLSFTFVCVIIIELFNYVIFGSSDA